MRKLLSSEVDLFVNVRGNVAIFYGVLLILHRFLSEPVRKLSHREAQLLMLLSENRNGATKRKDILMQLWGDDSFFNSRNLDVYITKLREYLKADTSIEIITIKGVGYHFTVG